MDHLQKLTLRGLLCAALVLFGCTPAAYALGETQPAEHFYYVGSSEGATPDAACQAAAAKHVGPPAIVAAYIFSGVPDDGKCIFDIMVNGQITRLSSNAVSDGYRCPAGYSLGGQTCTKVEQTACDTLVANANASGATFSTPVVVTGPPPLQACVQGCTVEGSFGGKYPGGTMLWGPFRNGGMSCTGTGQPAPTPFPPGKCPGQVNGVDVPGGVPCGTTTTPPGTTTTTPTTTTPTPSPGSPGAPGTPGAPPPGQSSTSTTSCTNGSCTTTTTTVNVNPPDNSSPGTGANAGTPPGSTSSSTTTTTEPQDSFCSKNPQAPQCKKAESTFGGSCSATSCTGDAIQCAIAAEQARRNCQLMDTPTPLSQLGTAATTAGDRPGDHPANAPSATSVDLSSVLGVSNPFGSTCLPDKTIPLWDGHSFAIPLADKCWLFQAMGAIAVAFTTVICGLMVIRSV